MTTPDFQKPTRPAPTSGIARRSALWLTVSGVLGIALGIVALVYPDVTALALGLLLGFGLLIQGMAGFVAGLRAWPGTPGRTALMVFGILTAIAGLICVIDPGTGVFAIILGLVIWFATVGVTELVLAFKGAEHRVSNAVLGVIGIVAAIVLIVDAGTGIRTIAVIAAFCFFVRGVGELVLARRVRQLDAS